MAAAASATGDGGWRMSGRGCGLKPSLRFETKPIYSPTNIWGRLKSIRAPPIFVGADLKLTNVIYIRRSRVPTNILSIDEYIVTNE
jgi:hypothetical protein